MRRQKPSCAASITRLCRVGIIVTALATASGCTSDRAGGTKTASTPQQPATAAGADITDDAYRWADSVAASMSVEERIGQMLMPGIYASADNASIARIKHYTRQLHVGGIVLLKGDMASAAILADTIQRMSSPGHWIAIDAEWGLAMRLADAPRFPANGNLSPLSDDQLMYDYGYELARECRRLGINMLFGPVIDVTVTDKASFIGNRSFGSDQHRVAELGVAYARGVEDGSLISVAKHFPGHGSPKTDTHRFLGIISHDAAQLDSIDLYPFRKFIEAGLSAVMVGHLAVPAIDPMVRSAAASPVVMKELLRGRLGFKGLVITDALNMGGAEGAEAVEAILAGADIVIAPSDTRAEIEAMVRAFDSGRLTLETIDDRVRRILFYKYLAGLGTPGRIPLNGLASDIDTPHAAALRRRLSR